MKKRLVFALLWIAGISVHARAQQKNDITLASSGLKVAWQQQGDGWHVQQVTAGGKSLPKPSGYYTILYTSGKPRAELVTQNQEGSAFSFYPANAERLPNGALRFRQELPVGDVEATWQIDPAYPNDIHVQIQVKAKSNGFFSISSPTLAVVEEQDLSWGMVPGNWYGRAIQHNLTLATQYSMGLPAVPVIAREKSTMTLCPLITTKGGITMAVVPDTGTAADPWKYDNYSRGSNKVALSTMNRHYELTPVAYAPVLGGDGSQIKAGETVSFSFRYCIQATDWFPVFRHAVEDIYHFPQLLQVQQEKISLSERIRRMQLHLQDDKKSRWTTWKSSGLTIGANGTKNADLGAMWMMANASADSGLKRHLPYVRNYKLAQQQMQPGFFQYAALGEYGGKDGFNSEVGNWVEPIFTTYYTLIDMGNILLFQPKDDTLKQRLRLAADKLLSWQHEDGGWEVAYDRFQYKPAFPGLQDLRPTWYGMLVAYRILGDQRYLQAAEKGADWFIRNGVNKGYYLGVCGDARNIWDFATAQSSQALLDLYEITKKEPYKQAAIEASKVYATSIFTHPVASTKPKLVNGVQWQDWEINQTGLGVEHPQGSAPGSGPILLTSFTGLFVRMFDLTKDSLFLHMARGAARGRHAFMDTASGQTVYYWKDINRVKERVMTFPHQTYWQIGWMMDYLLSEVHLRSKGKVAFPRGFMTPKVGPHESYGFAPGAIFSKQARLWMPPGLFSSNNPNLEHIGAVSSDGKLYVMVLNQSPAAQSGAISIDLSKVMPGRTVQWTGEQALQGSIARARRDAGQLELQLPGWGLSVVEITLKN